MLIGYEVPLGFAAIGPVMAAQSLSTVRIVTTQTSLWYAVWQPFGVAIYVGSGSVEDCVRRADEALYAGKSRGKNQVVLEDAA